ncbi:MAG: glycosyltransferase family 2 protein [Gemmatimonadota bacterium]
MLQDLLPALPWLLPYLAVLRILPRKPDLADAPDVDGTLISIVIPARNESATIATLLTSLLSTRYRSVEIIVVDDRSTDDTSRIVSDFARRDSRVRLHPGQELPEGWYGKPWACFQGYREARGDMIVFTDADTRHEPDLLLHAVGAMEQEHADLVTVITGQRCVSFWERVIMPQIWILIALRYFPRRINRATRPRDVIANGQFIMVRRTSYERAGTHEAVRDKVAEDLALAQVFLRRGLKLHMAFGESLIETRMYTGWRTLVEGWTKNIYLGGQASFPDEPLLRALAPLALVFTMLFWLWPVAWLGLSIVSNGNVYPSLLAAGLCVLFWAGMCRAMRIPPVYGLAYPIGSAAALFIVLKSAWRGARGVEWKGRVYSGLDGKARGSGK